MKLIEVVGEKINERYFYMKHPYGLDIYLYPKKGYKSSYAILGVKYGSIDAKFKTKDKGVITVPDGIAHYLEHKLFEGKEANAFDLYAKTGASANAYTSFDKTAYLFSCSEKFEESLKILLDFVQSPYFTDESVEKERGIIAQEIKMYEDNPEWRVYFNLLGAMYKNHPIRIDIAGTVESISKITPEYLYQCYETFYNLNNMSLCVSGNIDVDKTMEVIDKNLKKSEEFTTRRILPDEPFDVLEKRVEQKFDIGCSIFQVGFKEKVKSEMINEKDLACVNIVLRALSSKASPMYNKLLDLGLINTSSFSCDYMEAPFMAGVSFSGESSDPDRAAEIIKDEISGLRAKGIDYNTFLWAKKSVYGETVSGFNSVNGISNDFLDFSFAGREIFKYIDSISSVTLDEVNERFKEQLDPEKSTLSVVSPL